MEREFVGQVDAILRGISEAVTVQKLDGNLVYANPAAAELIGYPSVEALLASPISEIANALEISDEHGSPLPVERLPGRLALRGQQPPETLVHFRLRATGEERWTLLSARPISDASGQVQYAVNVFRDVTERQRAFAAERAARARAEAAQGQLSFLAQAGELLAQSLDFETTLHQVARLAVPDIADWCAVDLLQEDGSIDRLAVAHRDPSREALARELFQRYPPDPAASTGLHQVLRSGEPELYPEITDEMLVQGARDAEHLAIMRGLNLRSLLIVPLKTRQRVLGALTLASAESDRAFGDADLALARQLAVRAALAVDNARLYREATRSSEELEAQVVARTRQLRARIAQHQRAENRFRQLLESAPDAIVIVDGAGCIVLANAQAEQLFGYTRQEIEGQLLEELVLPEALRRRHQQHRSRFYGEPQSRPMGRDLELYARRKDGTLVPVEISLSPLREGQRLLVIAAVRDISRRKEAAAALQTQQRQLAQAQRIAQLGSWDWQIGAARVGWSDEMYRIAGADPQNFVPTYEAMAAFYHSDDRDAVLATLDRVRREGWPGELQCRLVRANGQVRVIHLRCQPVFDENHRVLRLLGTWQDVSELWQAERMNRALLELGKKLNAVLDLDSVMDVLAQEAVGFLEAQSGFAAYRTPEGLVASRYFHQGELVPIDQSWRLGEGIPGRVLESKEPYLTNDAAGDAQVNDALKSSFALRTVLCAPILDMDGEVIGVIEVNNKRDGSPFDNDDVHKLASLTPMAGIAIHNAQLYERQRELSRQVVSAQEEERSRLSRELHDSAGQLLTALGMQLAMLADDTLQDEEQHRQELREAAQLAEEAHDEIRAVSHALRPPPLAHGGLDDALRSLCDDFARRTNLKIVYRGQDVPQLPDAVAITLYRFLQETLSNAARHASAKAIEVCLRHEQEELSLTVADDGIGFNVTSRLSSPSTSRGVGLLGLQERFDLLGGDIFVISAPGEGTRITGRCRVSNGTASHSV